MKRIDGQIDKPSICQVLNYKREKAADSYLVLVKH